MSISEPLKSAAKRLARVSSRNIIFHLILHLGQPPPFVIEIFLPTLSRSAFIDPEGFVGMGLHGWRPKCREWLRKHQVLSTTLIALTAFALGGCVALAWKSSPGTALWMTAYLIPMLFVCIGNIFGAFLAFLGAQKDAFGSIQSLVTAGGIVWGGIWAVKRFGLNRERYPRAKLQHRISFWDFSETHRLLRVVLDIENTSGVLLRVAQGKTFVQQMKPWPEEFVKAVGNGKSCLKDGETEAEWPLICKAELKEAEVEPKESDELCMDFVIEKSYQQVLVYSYIKNIEKPKETGWRLSTVVDFTQTPMAKDSISVRQKYPKPEPKPAKKTQSQAKRI